MALFFSVRGGYGEILILLFILTIDIVAKIFQKYICGNRQENIFLS